MNKHLTTTILSAFLSLLILINIGCNKSGSDIATIFPVTATYSAVTNVTTTTAIAYVVVTSYGDGVLTSNGVCYSSTNQNPTIADTKTSNTVDTAYFAAKLTGLTPNTTYYVRAYASNNGGTGYGDVVKFKTNSANFAITPTVTTFAGSGISGAGNGTGTNASFNSPQGVCTDPQGNVYVADFGNNLIRKITPGGITTTFAGDGTLGYKDATGTAAEFYAPTGVASDTQGNIYVADFGNNMIRKITTTGVVTTLAGRGDAGYSDGTGTASLFRSPTAVAVDAAGNVYVADRGNNVIRKITTGGVVTTLAGNPVPNQIDGTGTATAFNAPSGIAADAAGNVFVADLNNHAIRKITPAGVVTTVAGNVKLATVVPSPTGVCLDAQGNLYITDANNTISEITAGALYPVAGSIGLSGAINGTTKATFSGPIAITADLQGNLYVADLYNNLIRKVNVTIQP